jgi:single stranded DNA-binding protein
MKISNGRRYPLLNKVMFIGRLVRDCEVKYLESGTQITHFCIALDGAGNQGTEAAFLDFSKIGEFNVSEYLKKGTKIFVEGHIDQARKEVDGKKRTFTNFLCDRLQLLSGTRSSDDPIATISEEDFDLFDAEPIKTNYINLEDKGAQKVFLHLQKHTSITEQELIQMLGTARQVRRFSLNFEEYLKKVPFSVRIETNPSGKRYIRQS